MNTVRYSYGFTAALLAGGAALSLATGYPAGAQVAQNDEEHMRRVVPRAGAPESFADLTAQLQPAVVNISTRQRVTVEANPFAGTPFGGLFRGEGAQGEPATREAQSLGSGFIVSADGYVVTNNHVISPPDSNAQLEEVTVTLPDGTEYVAEVVGKDAESDLAVLKIQRGQPFPFVRFGDSANARVGDWVIAIGNPFGLGGTVTSGIVSSVLRSAGAGAYDRYLQTDASINRGNSGGPLFDMQGNVIGINNAIFSPSGGNVGIGFAIPAEIAAPLVRQLISGEEIRRGYLGVQIQQMNPDLAEALNLPPNRGEFIQSVQPGEAAEQAGLEAGDVVVAVGGQEVTPDQTLSYLVTNTEPGTTIPLDIIRDGEPQRLRVTVGQRPSAEQLAAAQFGEEEDSAEPSTRPGTQDASVIEGLGVQAIPLTRQIARQLGLGDDAQGLVVTAVDPGSDAASKGISRGTVVLSANGEQVTQVSDLEAAISEAREQGREAVLLRVRARGGPALLLPVRLR